MFSVDSRVKFTFEDNKYCLVFDLYVMNQLQDIYGTLYNWTKKIDEEDFNALLVTLEFMLNEGVKTMRDEGNIDYNFPKHESVVKIATIENIRNLIIGVIEASLGNTKNSKKSNNKFKEKIDFAQIYMFCASQLHMSLDQSKILSWNDHSELVDSYFEMMEPKGQKSFKKAKKRKEISSSLGNPIYNLI